jgi:tRNA pseudouridine55 synthase
MEGLLCIDKPLGITSHDAVNAVRRLAGMRRVGHAGTLDPLATGLLLICLGRATRLLEYLVGQPKAYIAKIQLGRETSTYDAEGETVAESPVDVSVKELHSALDNFRGTIIQLAPLYSAVKVDGQPLYRRARHGEKVERPERTVTIYQLDMMAWSDAVVELHIRCSSGTYIRSIAHDLGQDLGCGAFLASLRRTEVGKFSVSDAVPLSNLHQDDWHRFLQPTDSAVGHLPRLDLSSEEALTLYYGQTVQRHSGQTSESLARAYDDQGCFVGVVSGDTQQWRAKKIFYQPDQG